MQKEAFMSRSSALSRFLRIAPAVLLGLLLCAGALAQTTTAFSVESPMGITVGPDGAIWFTSYFPQTIGRIDANGAVTEFPTPHSSPVSIASGPDGNLWYTVPSGRIGRMTTSGVVTEFALPGPVSRPEGITSGPDGNLWFIEGQANRIGRITTSGVVTEFPVPGTLAGIAAGPDGNIWFTDWSTRKIGRITSSGTVTEFGLPRTATTATVPWAIIAGPDGNLWFTEGDLGFGSGGLGRITPAGVVTEFWGESLDYAGGIVAGADGNIWVGNGATLTRVSTTGSLTGFPVPVLTEAMAAAPDGSIWFTDYESHQVVRFAFQTTSCVADAKSLCLDNGRFRVAADWKAGDGSTGHGHGVGLTANSGYFWFFDKNNVEMVVKVLDGCSTNQHQWAFAAGLTNVEVTTTVTDTFSGLSKTYTNAQGTPFAPIQDTAAFASCP
jgi:streptogramin lyase